VKESEKNTFYDHFGKNKPTVFGNWLVKRTCQQIFDFAQINEGKIVLEVGPGRGAFADICLGRGIEYWAIEPNVKMADELQKRGANIIRNIVPPIPDIERSFDVVVMNNVLEHMETMSNALSVSKQIYELLNPGGRFVIYSPDYVNFGYLFFLTDFSHNYVTTWKRIEGLLISAGFDAIRARYQNALFRGISCILTSGLAAWMPFGHLSAIFPNNKVLNKLFRFQIPFMRRVLIYGEKNS
jgi:SAM-dependent methyltransferase